MLMEPASSAPALGGSLSPDHRQALLAANLRAKKIRGAIGVAAFNGWSVAVFAVLSLPFAFGSWSSLIVVAGLGLVAYNEFRGRNGLRRFDPAAARLLGWNQLGLWALLVGYSAWSIGCAFVGPNPYEDILRSNPDVAALSPGSLGSLYITVTLAVYGGVIIAATLMQGLNAWYYFSREKHVRAYLDETPKWVVDVHRTTGG